MYILLSLLQENQPLWKTILTGIPHTPAAIFLYLLLAVCGVVLWRAHRGTE
jgi:hypothetical protein